MPPLPPFTGLTVTAQPASFTFEYLQSAIELSRPREPYKTRAEAKSVPTPESASDERKVVSDEEVIATKK